MVCMLNIYVIAKAVPGLQMSHHSTEHCVTADTQTDKKYWFGLQCLKTNSSEQHRNGIKTAHISLYNFQGNHSIDDIEYLVLNLAHY